MKTNSKKAKTLKAERILNDGHVMLRINGEVLPPVAYMTYYPDAGAFAAARADGIRLFSFGVYAQDRGINDLSGLRAMRPNFWTGEDTYCFDDLDRIMEMICPEHRDVWMIPRVDLDVPVWWEKKYPEELCRDDRGQPLRQSFASEKWRSDAKRALRALIDHVNASPWRDCVAGYHIAAGGTEEWTYNQTEPDHQWRVDFSEVNRVRYQNWLKTKYQTITDLNRAWMDNDYGIGYKNFADICFPTLLERTMSPNMDIRNPDRERAVIDYWEYNSFLFSDTILDLCSEVRRYTGGKLLIGVFYGYTFLAGVEKGHFSMKSVLESDAVDFVATTSSGTGPGEGRPFWTVAHSLLVHGKFYFNEGDIRTCLSTLLSENIPQAVPENHYYTNRNVWKGPVSMELSLSALRKAAVRVLTGNAGIWWFDMFGGWFDHPKFHEFFRNFLGWQREQTGGPLKSEIAVLIDETGIFRYPRCAPADRQARQGMLDRLNELGAPYDLYLVDDLVGERIPLDQYRLFIMMNTVETKPAVLAAAAQLKKRECTVLWTGYGSMEKRDQCGFDVSWRFLDERRPKQGLYRGERFPDEPVPCPKIRNVGVDARMDDYILATVEKPEDGEIDPAVMARYVGRSLQVVSVFPMLPISLMRELAVWSGVNLYMRTGDIVFAGGRFVGIHAREAGEKRVHMPFAVEALEDAETGERISLNAGVNADLRMKQYETRILRVIPFEQKTEGTGSAE